MRISDWSSDVCSSDLLPAYLADLFGTRYVGGIHGRLLTAWAAGGILGPVLVKYIRQYQVNHGVPPSQAYTETLYILAASLIGGLICNFFVRPVSSQPHMSAARTAEGRVGKEGARAGRAGGTRCSK